MSDRTLRPIVLALTGASGTVYAARLLEALLQQQRCVELIASDAGRAVAEHELGVRLAPDCANWIDLVRAAYKLLRLDSDGLSNLDRCRERVRYYRSDDYFTPIASGSHLTDGMVICPCSGSTLSGIARAASNNLIQRAAEVHMKERRKLVLVPRETPLSTLQLENMMRLSQAGAVILPAAPGWYHGVTGLVDLVDFVVARVMDHLAVEHQMMRRWGGLEEVPGE